jgi:hypothetical protein
VFVVDAAVLLPHPRHVVARVAGRLTLLPRWCAGLRRVRHPAPESAPDPAVASGCVFTYAAADVRLTLHARTLPPGADLEVAPAAAGCVTHAAAGDGLTLTWTLAAEPPLAAAAGGAGGPADAGRRPPTRLRARVEVAVDPGHPLAAARATLCRTIARRVPADLERLRALLDCYEAGRRGPGDRIPRGADGGRAATRPA